MSRQTFVECPLCGAEFVNAHRCNGRGVLPDNVVDLSSERIIRRAERAEARRLSQAAHAKGSPTEKRRALSGRPVGTGKQVAPPSRCDEHGISRNSRGVCPCCRADELAGGAR